MRLLNKLTIKSLVENRKRTIMTIIGIMLAVTLITSVANLYASAKETLITHVQQKSGNYHYGFKNLSEKEIEKLRQNRKVESIVVENETIYVRYTKAALKDKLEVHQADFRNDELIDLETAGFLGNSWKLGTLENSVIIVICMIMLTSIMCIKSSFDISITERIRQYGMFASIGATSVQIRKNVYYEAFILALAGIPLGLTLGIVASYSIILICAKAFDDILVYDDLIYSFSWIAMLVSIFLSILTIFFSADQAARKASRITPIQAIRSYNKIKIKKEDLSTPKWIHKYLGIGGEISYKNIRRNRQKYQTTMFSLIICISLFIAVSSFVSTGLRWTEVNYNGGAYNLSLQYNGKEKLSQYIKSIEELPNVKKVSYSGRNRIFLNSHEYTDGYKNILQSYYLDEDVCIGINVINDDSFKEYTERLQLNYNEVKDKGILINNTYVSNEASAIKTACLDIEEGDVISGVIREVNQEIASPYQIQVAKVTEEIPMGLKKEEYGGVCLVLELSEYCDMINLEEYNESIYIRTANSEKTESDLKYLLQDLLNDSETFWLINWDEEERESLSFYLLISVFLYSSLTVIASIGVTNIFNIISANMNLRKREFAMLKSIGMTTKEFNRMILLESLFYGRVVLIVGVPVGLALSYLINGNTESDLVPYRIPYLAVFISIIAVLTLLITIMRYSLEKINQQNTIETIQKENI